MIWFLKQSDKIRSETPDKNQLSAEFLLKTLLQNRIIKWRKPARPGGKDKTQNKLFQSQFVMKFH